jgi:hypothetical protein
MNGVETMNKKFLLRICLSILFIAFVVFSIYSTIKIYRFFNPITELNTISPNKTYAISMKEKSIDGDDNFTQVIIKRNEETIADDDIFYANSGCFLCWYGNEYVWLGENTLRFGEETYPNDTKETLTLKNNSSKTIKFLRIKTYSYFLVFDMKSGEEVSFTTSTRHPIFGTPSPTDWRSKFKEMSSGGIELWGKFTDDSKIKGSFSFKTIEKGIKSNARYFATITNEKVEITSSDYQAESNQ